MEQGNIVVRREAFAASTSTSNTLLRRRRIAVLVPCYNEALTIAQVVEGFRTALPEAIIYVYDNNSTDGTAEIARSAHAVVRTERRQGKGNVVRQMFGNIEADCYVIVDGDNTYDPGAAVEAVTMVAVEGYDFVNVARSSTAANAYRRGHRFGNIVLTQIVRSFFGRETSDMLSGFKVMSRRFVKSFPAMSRGFEVETELTVHALEMRMSIGEISAVYRERPEGSASKLRTYRDGMRILLLISRLIKDERPFAFFSFSGAIISLSGVLLGIPLILTYIETGLVPRLPTAVLSLGMVMLGFMAVFTGLILHVVTKSRQEFKRLMYLLTDRVSP